MFRLHTIRRFSSRSVLPAAAALLLAGCSPPAPPPPAAKPVLVTAVRNSAAEQVRSFTATLRARYEAELSFRTGGKVTERLVEVGQILRAGQVLARLDPSDYALAVAAAADQVRAAKVDAEQAASDEARFRRLLQDGSVGAADHERQKARAEAAAARHEQATRQLELARNRAGYATLVAPYAGVVTALRVEAGQVVAEGQTVLSIARPGEIEVVADLPEQLAAQAQSWNATARLWERNDVQLNLKLREISPIAAAQARTFRARFAIVGADEATPSQLRLGMTSELRLTRGDSAGAAALPATALLKTSGVPAVWLVDSASGGLKQHPVEVLSYAQEAVIVAGLPDGAQVVSVGAQKLDAALKVVAVERTGSGLALEGVLPAPPMTSESGQSSAVGGRS